MRLLGAQEQAPPAPASGLNLFSDIRRRLRGVALDRYYTRAFYRQERYRIAHAPREPRGLYHFLYGESAFRMFKRACPAKRVVCTFHQPPAILERYVAQPERFGDMEAAVIMSGSQRAYFEQYLPPDRIHHVPHGIDTARFTPPAHRTPSKRLLLVGVWLRDFGIARKVMEALGRIDREIHLDVVTLPRFQAHFMGLANVRMHSGISEEALIGLYRRAALLFMPLKDGTFNNAMGEALACGLPAVVGDVGGIRDYADARCACLVPACRVEAYVEAIRSLLADPDRCAALSVAARERAEQLDWQAVLPSLLDVYRTLGTETDLY